MIGLQIEDYVIAELVSEEQEIALDFVTYLRSFNLEFEKDNGYWRDKIYYIIKYQSKCICFISIKDLDEPDNHWTVWSDDMSSELIAEYPLESGIKEIAWRHVDICGNCGSCDGGRLKNIFGREFPKVCGCTFRVDNPGKEELVFLKKMVEIRIAEIENATSAID